MSRRTFKIAITVSMSNKIGQMLVYTKRRTKVTSLCVNQMFSNKLNFVLEYFQNNNLWILDTYF